MSLYSRTPGRRPPSTGLITIARMSPSGPGTWTSSSCSFTPRHTTGRPPSPGSPRPSGRVGVAEGELQADAPRGRRPVPPAGRHPAPVGYTPPDAGGFASTDGLYATGRRRLCARRFALCLWTSGALRPQVGFTTPDLDFGPENRFLEA